MKLRWILVLIGFIFAAQVIRADDTVPRLRLKAELRSATIQPGEDPGLSVRVECRDQKTHDFSFGSVPQLFRIDILGPWGPIPEGPDEGSREAKINWMHQEHSTTQRITLDRSHPFECEISLRDYFPIGTSDVFRPGRYWIHVKFYSTELGMKNPVDATPIKLNVQSRRDAHESTAWKPVIVGKVATVSVAKTLFEQKDGKYFLAAVRVTNTSDREIGVDLRSREHCVRINQWSATDTAERGIIDERRAIPVPFTNEDQSKLVAAFQDDKLVRIPAGKYVDYYCPFIGEERSSNRAAVESLQTRFVILSMDGELRVTDAERCESLRCGEPGEADVSIGRPVPWHRVPVGGRILSDDGVAVEGTSPGDVESVDLTPAEPGSGWMIRFLPDGSGYAQFGSARGDRADLPKESVDFGALLKAACRLKSDRQLEQASTLVVSFKDGTNEAFSLTDDTLFRYLMESCEDKWQAGVGRGHWDTLRRQHPIFKAETSVEHAQPHTGERARRAAAGRILRW